MVNLTVSTKPVKAKEIKREWHLIDASSKILGRLAPEVVKLLQGKHKINYVPYLDMGDYVVVINAKKIVVSGKKANQKIYTRYSGYPGGLKEISFNKLLEKKPEEILKRAVSGMLPKNKLRKKRLARLYVFADENHPFADKFKNSK
jgi:large subunit ribosomal protein L13